jgi:hypothetical protein
MARARPQFVTAKLDSLHPTQCTVGMQEVALKRVQWQQLKRKARIAALANHWFPAIAGPDNAYYIVDHHHFGLALLQEAVRDVALLVLQDLSFVDKTTFWSVMEHHQWTHPYDAQGVRCRYDALPRYLQDLQDDPYRSLAGMLRRAGGFAKDVTPFSEFLWANFLRAHMTRKQLQRTDGSVLERALKLAHGQSARYLPGWAGQVDLAHPLA